MKNVLDGLRFEMDFAKLLAANGFWAHRITPNAAGQQPADIIAVKGTHHLLIDCKLVSHHHGFYFTRVEDNQRDSMDLFKVRGGEQGWFAILLPDRSIWMLGMDTIIKLEQAGEHMLRERDMPEYCEMVGEWIERWTT